MSVAEIIAARSITEVVHFTTHVGVVGSLHLHAVKSRERLGDEESLEHILQLNTPLVKDPDWIDYVNLSITDVNANLFRISREEWHADLPWYVLAFDPVILTHEGVVFATCNNAHDHVRRGKGAEGLEALFAQAVRWGYYNGVSRRKPGMKPNQPTSPEAEVLYPGELSTKWLRRIYARSGEDGDQAAGYISGVGHEEIEICIDPERFP